MKSNEDDDLNKLLNQISILKEDKETKPLKMPKLDPYKDQSLLDLDNLV